MVVGHEGVRSVVIAFVLKHGVLEDQGLGAVTRGVRGVTLGTDGADAQDGDGVVAHGNIVAEVDAHLDDLVAAVSIRLGNWHRGY